MPRRPWWGANTIKVDVVPETCARVDRRGAPPEALLGASLAEPSAGHDRLPHRMKEGTRGRADQSRRNPAARDGILGSKTLLTAIELGLFSELAKGPHDARTLQRELRLQARGARDFFDALVSLGMLERVGEEYRNTPATDLFLDRAKPSYAGTLLEMASARSYPFWGSLTEALRTGHPQNEAKAGENSFAVLYKDPDRLGQFLHAMTVLSIGDARAIAEKSPGSGTRPSSTSGQPRGACRSTLRYATPACPAEASTFPRPARSSSAMSAPSVSQTACAFTRPRTPIATAKGKVRRERVLTWAYEGEVALSHRAIPR